MGGSDFNSSATNTPRTPHSPNSAPAAAMSSPRPGSSSAPVRPVTARTWQALAAPPPPTNDARRVSVYNNDLYCNPDGREDARPASPHYQPASARPGTPTPKSAERLQQQRIATPIRLQAEHGSSLSPRLQQQIASKGLSTPPAADATVTNPTGAAAAAAAVAAAASTATSQGVSGSDIPPRWQQQLQDYEPRPTTAPAPGKATAAASLRTSTISLSSLKQHPEAAMQKLDASSLRPAQPIAGSSIAVDSPRVRQQLLRHFVGAVPAGGDAGPGSPHGGSPRPTLHGDRGTAAGGGRPTAPSFHPIAQTARPATALPGASSAAVAVSRTGPGQFSIKADHGRAGSGSGGVGDAADAVARHVAAYPQPPMTAPPKASAQVLLVPANPPRQPQPGSLASFGITSSAFVAAVPKAMGANRAAAAAAGGGEAAVEQLELRALTQDAMVAMAGAANRAELRRFLLAPGPADKPLFCKILRSGGGLLRGSPQYTLLVEQEGGKAGTFLIAARKRKGGPGGATYVLSVDQHDISRHSASYVGKVHSNFVGSEFVIYDGGDKQLKEGAGGRCELGAALYQTNVLGTKGPRKMTVVIPKLEGGGQRPLAVSPRGDFDTLLNQYKSYNLSSSAVLRNKPPRWNQAVGAYCLNFGGRVTQASVKNFQLVSVDNMDRTILQFGKVANDVFTMDYSYPMTALQAFAICLSSFDSKLACE